MYEHTAGIYDHSQRGVVRPLSSVALHETEENTTTSRLYSTIEAFKNKGIKDLFGLNLIDFLNLPSEYCTFLLELANKEGTKNQSILDSLNSSINKK